MFHGISPRLIVDRLLQSESVHPEEDPPLHEFGLGQLRKFLEHEKLIPTQLHIADADSPIFREIMRLYNEKLISPNAVINQAMGYHSAFRRGLRGGGLITPMERTPGEAAALRKLEKKSPSAELMVTSWRPSPKQANELKTIPYKEENKNHFTHKPKSFSIAEELLRQANGTATFPMYLHEYDRAVECPIPGRFFIHGFQSPGKTQLKACMWSRWPPKKSDYQITEEYEDDLALYVQYMRYKFKGINPDPNRWQGTVKEELFENMMFIDTLIGDTNARGAPLLALWLLLKILTEEPNIDRLFFDQFSGVRADPHNQESLMRGTNPAELFAQIGGLDIIAQYLEWPPVIVPRELDKKTIRKAVDVHKKANSVGIIRTKAQQVLRKILAQRPPFKNIVFLQSMWNRRMEEVTAVIANYLGYLAKDHALRGRN